MDQLLGEEEEHGSVAFHGQIQPVDDGNDHQQEAEDDADDEENLGTQGTHNASRILHRDPCMDQREAPTFKMLDRRVNVAPLVTTRAFRMLEQWSIARSIVSQ